MQKYLETKLFGIDLTAEVPPNTHDSMYLFYEFSVYSESEGFMAYEQLSATQFNGYYQRDTSITVDNDRVTIRQIREFFSGADANSPIAGAIQECLDQGELQFSGYSDLFIDELNSRNIGFELVNNEIT